MISPCLFSVRIDARNRSNHSSNQAQSAAARQEEFVEPERLRMLLFASEPQGTTILLETVSFRIHVVCGIPHYRS